MLFSSDQPRSAVDVAHGECAVLNAVQFSAVWLRGTATNWAIIRVAVACSGVVASAAFTEVIG